MRLGFLPFFEAYCGNAYPSDDKHQQFPDGGNIVNSIVFFCKYKLEMHQSCASELMQFSHHSTVGTFYLETFKALLSQKDITSKNLLISEVKGFELEFNRFEITGTKKIFSFGNSDSFPSDILSMHFCCSVLHGTISFFGLTI